MQKEIQIICGKLQILDLPAFLKQVNSIDSKHGIAIQGLNSDLIAGEKHLHSAIEKALRAEAEGKNVAKDPGVEIMRYAAGERQIGKSFSIGLHEGENNAVFILLGKKANILSALPEMKQLITEKTCSEMLSYSEAKREGIISHFGITAAEIEAAGEEKIPELVLERVALADFSK